eukprot:g3722.t1
MTNMAVKQIEFYFTVENLCKDIFIRSYMDEEGYIPIAFVANFPGVARFGVELADITAGILASDTLQVDTENETMRMRENWEVWLLPNQATGKQGVPRYIKVNPATVSGEADAASSVDTMEPGGSPEQTPTKEASANNFINSEGASNNNVEPVTYPAVQSDQQSISANAPAWTPGGVATDATLPVALPRDDKEKDTSTSRTAIPEGGAGEVGAGNSMTASETAAPSEKGGGENGDGSGVAAVEPKTQSYELNP